MEETQQQPGTYRQAVTADAPADEVFAFVSRVENLPRYFPAITTAEPQGGKQVHVEAEVDGQLVSGEAWIHVDPAVRSMHWGSEGPNNYHGELQVSERGPGTCEVAVTVHTTRAGGQDVADGLRDTVSQLARRAAADAPDTT